MPHPLEGAPQTGVTHSTNIQAEKSYHKIKITTRRTKSELRHTQQISTQPKTTFKTREWVVVQKEINSISRGLLKIPKNNMRINFTLSSNDTANTAIHNFKIKY
jgi:hypothetical protein